MWPSCFIDPFFRTLVSIVQSKVLVLHGTEIGIAVKRTDLGAVGDVVSLSRSPGHPQSCSLAPLTSL